MYSATAIQLASAGGASGIGPEKVGVHHIRLALSLERTTARVWSFHAADQVLSSWAARLQGALECEFEIVYDDGHTLAGVYRFSSKRNTRPSLMGFVRRAIQAMDHGGNKGFLVFGLSMGPQGFLTDYATDDC